MIGRSDSCPLIIFFYTPFYVLRSMRLGVITLIRNSPGGRRAGPFGSMSRLAFCFRELNIWKARQTSKSFGLIEARQCPQQLWTSWKQMEGPNPVSMCSVYSEGGSEPIRLYVFRILRESREVIWIPRDTQQLSSPSVACSFRFVLISTRNPFSHTYSYRAFFVSFIFSFVENKFYFLCSHFVRFLPLATIPRIVN